LDTPSKLAVQEIANMNSENQKRLRKALIGQLESLQRAGVVDLPKPRATIDLQHLPHNRQAVGPAAAPVVAISAAATAPAPIAKESSPMPKPSVRTAAEPGTLFEAEHAPPQEVSTAATLEILQREVAGCTRCGELAGSRTQTVFGVGDPKARLCFLGEAPGADEDRLGEPFVGRAGQLLDKIIEACQMKRADVYICNVLKCRPPGNRNPAPDEAANCRRFLDRQLELVQPEFICCLGAVAAQNLLDTQTSIGKLRGKVHAYRAAKVVCTYHPAYLLRNPAAKKDTWEDMKFLMRQMGVEL
jgi:DNA polymerase